MKRDLILLHGALGSHHQFDALTDRLADLFHLHTFSFTGHGGQSLADDFSIDLFVNDTRRYMDVNSLASADIFGYSMGGYVALNLALQYPDRVGKIMTLGTKFLWNPEAAAKEVRMMNPDIIEQKVPAFAATLADRHAPADWKKIMRKTADMMTQLGNGLAMSDEDFSRIRHETLICIGDEDHMVTINESRDTADVLPNGRFHVIEGFRHPLEAVDLNILAGRIETYFK